MTARSERWADFRDQQREDIVRAVIDTVSNMHGEPLNVTVLVERAGISRKTFYKYFDTLDAALIFTQTDVQRRITARAVESAADAPNGRERFLGMLAHVASVARENPELIHFISYFDHTFRGDGFTQVQHQVHDAEFARESGRIVRAFDEGRADGSIGVHVHPDATIFAVGNSIIGLVKSFQIAASRSDIEIQEASIDLLVDRWRLYLMPVASD